MRGSVLKKNILPIILALLLSFTLSEQVFAYGNSYENEYIKIALKSVLKSELNYTASLSSDGFQLGTWDKVFNSFFDINDKKLFARVDSYYVDNYGNYLKTNDTYRATYGPFHIKTNKEFYSYEDALYEVDYLRNLNVDAFIYYSQGIFEIWVGQYLDEYTANENAMRYIAYFQSQTDIARDDKSRIMIMDENNEIILMFDKNQNIHLSSLNKRNESIISVENNSYREYITFSRAGDELIIINNLKLQNYLYGVVPKEMPSTWALEALKAQAIAAKNYSLINMNKHINEGYNLCDTTHCQVYGGYKSETIMTNRAVDEITGRILMYNDEIVDTYYHSSSGGYTEDSENVWGGKIAYLRGVEDSFSLGSPYDSWQYVISDEEIRAKLSENGLDVGYITDIQVISKSENGRVMKLMIKGTMGTQVLEKEKVRQVFGTSNIKSTLYEVYFNNGNGGSSISEEIYIYNMNTGDVEKQLINNANILSSDGLSTLDSTSKGVTITDGAAARELKDKIEHNVSNSEGKFVFSGKGWGHGVGMSQYGAKKMAEQGYTYEEILEYYYTGAKVK